jgi:hypothetical protein
VLANAATSFYLVGKTGSFYDGVLLAKQLIEQWYDSHLARNPLPW